MTTSELNVIPRQYKHVLAFEVAKAKLFVHSFPVGETVEAANTAAAVRRLIKTERARNLLLGLGPLLVVCEATGSYSKPIIDVAAELGVDCHRAHGSRVRAFAKFRGTHAKNDPIDVRLIADYAVASRDLVLHRPPRPEQAELRELVARRTELRQMKEAENARLEHVSCKAVVDGLRAHLRLLERQITALDARIAALTAADGEFCEKSTLMQSVKGVGAGTAAALLAYLPELGSVSRSTIAALAGLAPFDADSGEKKGGRHIFGGRAEVREALYMAAVVAMRWNPHLAAFAARIKAKGEPFKVQATAVMRKLLVILNGVVASGEPCRMVAAGRATPEPNAA
jgi:transposase